MNAFTKKSLVTALAAAGSLGMVGAANAVNVNPDGLGNVLVYPYYTVNKDPNGNAWATLLSVVNTTASAKAVKIRFREGLNSWEVLDFNIFLSHNDVWTGSVTPTSDGGAQITTSDKSCTIPANVVNVPFRSSTYQGDGGGNTIKRTAEGYFEIFEMASFATGTVTQKAVTHVNGVPPCGSNVNDTQAGDDADSFLTGGLFGTVVLVNASSGGAFTQNATALDNFATFGGYETTGSTLPDYSGADPRSNVISGQFFWSQLWGGALPDSGTAAVTAVLMAESVINEFSLEPSTTSATNWIITHPTKNPYVNGSGAPFAPFTDAWNTKSGGACEPVTVTEWDREEKNNVSQDFSPAQGGTALCYEANVVGFSAVNMFGSETFVNVAAPFANGWAHLDFDTQSVVPPSPSFIVVSLTGGGFSTASTSTYFGLPVIGFAAETFNNDIVTIGPKTFSASFGSEMAHRKTPAIFP